MKLILEVLGGYIKGQQAERRIFVVDSFPISIGRLPDNKVEIPLDEYVSRRHCTIGEDNGALYVADLGSTNSTYLNDEKINQSTFIKTNDELLIGRTRVKIIIES